MTANIFSREITFKCQAFMVLTANDEAWLDEMEERWSQQDCPYCQLEDDTLTLEGARLLAAVTARDVEVASTN